ncbi:serine hydrolase domain-containing protein [Candidatus Neomarinimicrobiota bacterium]
MKDYRSSNLSVLVATILSLIVYSCSEDATGPDTNTIIPEIPELQNDGWPVSSLEEQGMDAELLGEVSWEIRNGDFEEVHGLLIIKNGYLVFEEYYWEGHNNDFIHNLNSATKSIASAAIGIAVNQGLIIDIHQKIIDFFPEYADLLNLDPQKRNMELWHLLTMTAGFEWIDGVGFEPTSDNYAMRHSDNAVRFVLEKPIDTEPGSEFFYNGGVTMLLDGIIRNLSGLSTDEFAQEFLFEPLGITNYQWNLLNEGHTDVDGGLKLRARDLAKVGKLYLNKGIWDDKRIVTEEWITSSITPWIQVDEQYHYGFQWWLESLVDVFGDDSAKNDVYLASGFGGQKLYVIPNLDIVVVFQGCCHTNDCPSGTEIVEQIILRNYILQAIKDN